MINHGGECMIPIPHELEHVILWLAGLAGIGLWYLGMKELVALIKDILKYLNIIK